MKENPWDLIIIGGGASGLFASLFASKAGCRTLILEKKEQCAKKIYATGNGKCNFTNKNWSGDCFRGQDETKFRKILDHFPLTETLSFFHEIGVLSTEKEGYYYPNSEQAASVAEALIREARRNKVETKTERTVVSCSKNKDGFFEIRTEQESFCSKSLLIATGGKASPVHGSDGSGYLFAKVFGHTIEPVTPAIVQLKAEGLPFAKLAGVRLPGSVLLHINQKDYFEKGELLLTGYGISGIPVMQISRYASKELLKSKSVPAFLDFLPELSETEVTEELRNRFHKFFDENLSQALLSVCNQKLNDALLRKCGLMPEKKRVSVSEDQIKQLAVLYKRCPIEITGTNGFENAQATAGGVSLKELTENMESKKVEGLFFTGEVVDVDGTCGGYNLQWAWSSGAVAGKEIGRRYVFNTTGKSSD